MMMKSETTSGDLLRAEVETEAAGGLMGQKVIE